MKASTAATILITYTIFNTFGCESAKNFSERAIVEIFVYSYYIHDTAQIKRLNEEYKLEHKSQQEAYTRHLQRLTSDKDNWRGFLKKTLRFYQKIPRVLKVQYFRRTKGGIFRPIPRSPLPADYTARFQNRAGKLIRQEHYRGGALTFTEHYLEKDQSLFCKQSHKDGKITSTQYFYMGEALG